MDNNKKLHIEITIRFLLSLPLVGALLFLPAGIFDYWEAWVFAAVFLGWQRAAVTVASEQRRS
jgi:hypothetical protein